MQKYALTIIDENRFQRIADKLHSWRKRIAACRHSAVEYRSNLELKHLPENHHLYHIGQQGLLADCTRSGQKKN